MMIRTAEPNPQFQGRVWDWAVECFGIGGATDKVERNQRFLEEALELVQACGCTAAEAHQLVEYVFDRPTGNRGQEVGGVIVCLALLCEAHNLDMHEEGEVELSRIWKKVGDIRAKQAVKTRFLPDQEIR